MEFDHEIDWEFLNDSFSKAFPDEYTLLNQEEAFFGPGMNKCRREEGNGLEENVSTSISDMELQVRLMKPKITRLSCPECSDKVKAFQYNQEMAVFMCENTKVI